jgi:hypothetical protein
MNDEDWAFWRYLLTDTTIRLLKHYGMELSDESRRIPMLTDGDQVAGVVFFEGDRIRGGLTVCAPRLLLGIASPLAPDAQAPLADFARELANQILGGIKSRLASYGLDFSYSSPNHTEKPPLEAVALDDARVLVLRSGGGEIALMLAVSSEVRFGRGGYRSPRDLPVSGQLIML